MLKTLIKDFLNKFATKVPDNEDSSTTELYMDDHDCIEFENVQYYIPENNSFYTEEDEMLREMMVCKFGL